MLAVLWTTRGLLFTLNLYLRVWLLESCCENFRKILENSLEKNWKGKFESQYWTVILQIFLVSLFQFFRTIFSRKIGKMFFFGAYFQDTGYLRNSLFKHLPGINRQSGRKNANGVILGELLAIDSCSRCRYVRQSH